VRDFRDIVCSILSFNRKRGFQGFGAEQFSDSAAYIRAVLKPSVEMMVEAWKSRRDRAILLRYEDVVRDPEIVMVEVFRRLGVDCSLETAQQAVKSALDQNIRDQKVHMTSDDPDKSMDRHLRDLEPSLREVCEECFDGPLKIFGYR
jgi:hypothetical protein